MTEWKSRLLPWFMFAVVSITAFIAWAGMYRWQFGSMSVLTLFPLLGLLAWSIMWTHYALGGIRLTFMTKKNYLYTRVSGVIVLLCLLLHPGLLAYKMWDTTGILPPESFGNYTGPSLKWAVLLGTVSLLIFLTFEVFERFRKHPWIIRNWKFMSVAQMFAMTFIFVHALALGKSLHNGWFLYWWVFLGCLLLPCFALILQAEWKKDPVSRTALR